MRRLLPMCLALLALALAGCGSDSDDSEDTREEPGSGSSGPTIEDPGPIHVHGLGINPKDGALFIATHTGLFRAAEGEETAKRVAGRYQDTMGFTVVGPDRFLGSGHPDGRADLPPFLGLIRSSDAGESWQEVSLMGESDFHVLEASGPRVYGFGSNYETREPEFLVSGDGGRSWEERTPPAAIASLAISPDDPEHVVAAVQGGPADDGLYASEDAGGGWRPLADEVGLLAWTVGGSLFLVDPRGGVKESSDDGEAWRDVGAVEGQPAAFEAAGDDLYVALHDGTVKRSSDGGRSWTVRSRPRASVSS